ncbi:hypothetical protein EJ04DRAFT_588029 [Polyplosphaeria fusca]|uniref:C2H2-type domain-containing protein n=1 Tax=Polyplosphaeria fusca TaxID=682080 RepID=A0A9P4R7R8_9PLEO|nr:hypothetical protein EJ04DRAFT_588029 [Polyplosphaeria fusca]
MQIFEVRVANQSARQTCRRSALSLFFNLFLSPSSFVRLISPTLWHTNMPDFGWSASCVLEAIKLTNTVRKALRDTGGSASQYRDAQQALGSLKSLLEVVKKHFDNEPNSEYAGSIVDELEHLMGPLRKFESSMKKYEKCLVADSTSSKARQTFRKVDWALKNVDEGVRELEHVITARLGTINCFLSLSIHSNQIKAAKSKDKDNQQQLIKAIQKSGLVTDISDVLNALFEKQQTSNTQQLTCFNRLESLLSTIELQNQKSKSASPPSNSHQPIANQDPTETSLVLKKQAEAFQQLQTTLEAQLSIPNHPDQTPALSRLFVSHFLAFILGGLATYLATRTTQPTMPDPSLRYSCSIQPPDDFDPTPSPHLCPYCARIHSKPTPLPSPPDLESHFRTHHPDLPVPKRCPIPGCVEWFIKKENLGMHVRVEHFRVRHRGDGEGVGWRAVEKRLWDEAWALEVKERSGNVRGGGERDGRRGVRGEVRIRDRRVWGRRVGR